MGSQSDLRVCSICEIDVLAEYVKMLYKLYLKSPEIARMRASDGSVLEANCGALDAETCGAAAVGAGPGCAGSAALAMVQLRYHEERVYWTLVLSSTRGY